MRPITLVPILTTGLVAPAQAPWVSSPTRPQLNLARNVELLPAGKPIGTWHLTGLVRKDHTVVLRWGNDAGDIPIEGVRIFRQKVGDDTWKDLTGRQAIGFLRGRAAEKALDRMKPDEREDLLAYPFGDVAFDPVTRLRRPVDPKRLEVLRPKDFTLEKSLAQYRNLRATGQLSREDMVGLLAKADASENLAQALGLTFTDDPGRGQYRYKIVVNLLGGGTVDVVCPKVFNTSEPTPIPQPLNLTATSGNGEVLLNWDESSPEVLGGYNVYRSEHPNGPWKRLNEDPVKWVELDVEAPDITLRKALAVRSNLDRFLRPLPPAARTPQKVQEAQRQALEAIDQGGPLPELSPTAAQRLQAGLAQGYLRPGGPQAPRALFTDSIHRPGSGLQNERPYHYKVVSIDLGGQEQPLDTAPVIVGTPKDRTPPKAPGRPTLATEVEALRALRTVQTQRLASVEKLHPVGSLPASPGPTAPAAAPLSQTPRLSLAQRLATLPVAALKKVAEASLLRSLPDGTVPPAKLVWEPAPDPDTQTYRIHRSVGPGPLTPIAETGTPTWTDTNLEAGKRYRYAITAVDRLGNESGLSPIGTLEVCDASLPSRLGLQLKGSITPERAPSLPSRSFLKPLPARLKATTGLVATVDLSGMKTQGPLVTSFQAPKTTLQPTVRPPVQVRPPLHTPNADAPKPMLPAPQEGNASTLAERIQPIRRPLGHRPNPMTQPEGPVRELHVHLEWAKPLESLPLSYEVQQASPRMEALTHAMGTKGLQPLPFLGASTTKPMAQVPGAPLPGVQPNPRPQVLKGLVATEGQGLRVAPGRFQAAFQLVPRPGPGPFSRLNETPVTTEHFQVTFPAEVAQYGGTSVYFRVRAIAQEFGRPVEGPFSEPIEVRLPDLVPPPAPTVGSVDLQPTPSGTFHVLLHWTQLPAKDLVGVVVDRQALTFELVDGEAQPGTPVAPPERLTPTPRKGLTFLDTTPPTGYLRYTLRSVDATGNVSEAVGHLDVLVPGEPIPEAPSNLSLTQGGLTWSPAPHAQGYTVWRSFTGQDDWTCISGILPASVTHIPLPPDGTLHLKVVARSASGRHQTPSATVIRTP